jgi:hypothetical protein
MGLLARVLRPSGLGKRALLRPSYLGEVAECYVRLGMTC